MPLCMLTQQGEREMRKVKESKYLKAIKNPWEPQCIIFHFILNSHLLPEFCGFPL